MTEAITKTRAHQAHIANQYLENQLHEICAINGVDWFDKVG
jgi:hypothetical protein